MRAAGATYQDKLKGRRKHDARQRSYRARLAGVQKAALDVTHHALPASTPSVEMTTRETHEPTTPTTSGWGSTAASRSCAAATSTPRSPARSARRPCGSARSSPTRGPSSGTSAASGNRPTSRPAPQHGVPRTGRAASCAGGPGSWRTASQHPDARVPGRSLVVPRQGLPRGVDEAGAVHVAPTVFEGERPPGALKSGKAHERPCARTPPGDPRRARSARAEGAPRLARGRRPRSNAACTSYTPPAQPPASPPPHAAREPRRDDAILGPDRGHTPASGTPARAAPERAAVARRRRWPRAARALRGLPSSWGPSRARIGPGQGRHRVCSAPMTASARDEQLAGLEEGGGARSSTR